MIITITPESKNILTIVNDDKGIDEGFSDPGTFNKPGTFGTPKIEMTNESKNNLTITNETKY